MLQDTLVLVKPTEVYAHDAKKYKDECLELDGIIHGSGGLDQYEEYGEWLECLARRGKNEESSQEYCSQETYFAVEQGDDRIIGMVDIRTRLSEAQMRNGGNIGLSIRPCYRGEGYGKFILQSALSRCKELGMKEVLITCEEENVRAAKLVVACGGKEEQVGEEQEEILRFIIPLA